MALAHACGDGIAEVAPSGSGGSGQGTGPAVGAGGGLGGGGIPPLPTETADCQNKIYACGDLLDNDTDGLIDSQDPDCLGPCDNTEDSYFGGIPGQNESPCRQDCYFDGDTGHGNDDCYWSHRCDPNEMAPDYFPEPDRGAQCAHDTTANIPGTTSSCAELVNVQSQACLDYCAPLTPNGCDCFGCCELPAGSGSYVWLGSVGAMGNTLCTIDALSDPTVCHPCLPVAGCLNGCDPCELCLGKTTLPPECDDPDGGSRQQCPGGYQPCGLPGQGACPSGTFCITGCCIAVPE